MVGCGQHCGSWQCCHILLSVVRPKAAVLSAVAEMSSNCCVIRPTCLTETG